MFAVEKRLPTVAEYNHLRKLAEWPVIESDRASKGIANSLFGVCIVNENKSVVGMGRIAGDDAIYLHILDVIVHPEFQRRGIGKMVMKELINYVEKVAGKNTQIGLMASKGREKFYSDLGFMTRPNQQQGAGMIKIIS